MIDTDQAVRIVGEILPAVPRFPRGKSARVAVYAECARILADRCTTEAEARKICRSYQPLRWRDVAHFQAHVSASTGTELSITDQRAYAAHALNSLFEPLRLADKLIGWCGVPFPAELVDRARHYPHLTLVEQAQIGLDAFTATRAIERDIFQEILKLKPHERASLELYARVHYPEFIEPEPRGARQATCLAFMEWMAQK